MGLLFNYNKPGPGVEKNAPEKHAFFVFLETWLRNIFKLVPIGLVYTLFSVLILPCGLASAGITNVARNIARDKHSFGLSDFFETIRKNLKQALIAGIINLIATALLIIAIYYYLLSGGITKLVAVVAIIFLALFSMMKYYIWTMLITFDMSLKTIYYNSFYFAIKNILPNLLIGLVSLLYYTLAIVFFFSLPYSGVLFLIMVLTSCVFPGFKHLLIQFCIFPAIKREMIDKYYSEHPDDDLELRADLGVIDDEEEDEEIE